MEGVNKTTWGGKRFGAGRKKTGKKNRLLTISGTEHEVDSIRERARENKKTISRFVIEKCLDNTEK